MTTLTRFPAQLRHRLLLGAALLALLSLGLIPGVRAAAQQGYAALAPQDPELTRRFVEDLGWAGPLALLAAFVVQAVVPLLPSLVITAVTVLAYGFVEGFFIVYLGTLLGAAAGYGLGRGLGEPLVRTLAGETARRKVQDFVARRGVQGVLLLRLLPVLPSEVMSLVAGATRLGFRPFLLASAAGTLPVTLLIVWLSGNLQRLFIGLGLFSAAVVAAVLGRWLLNKRGGQSDRLARWFARA